MSFMHHCGYDFHPGTDWTLQMENILIDSNIPREYY